MRREAVMPAEAGIQWISPRMLADIWVEQFADMLAVCHRRGLADQVSAARDLIARKTAWAIRSTRQEARSRHPGESRNLARHSGESRNPGVFWTTASAGVTPPEGGHP